MLDEPLFFRSSKSPVAFRSNGFPKVSTLFGEVSFAQILGWNLGGANFSPISNASQIFFINTAYNALMQPMMQRSPIIKAMIIITTAVPIEMLVLSEIVL